jgi:hypothetical protein
MKKVTVMGWENGGAGGLAGKRGGVSEPRENRANAFSRIAQTPIRSKADSRARCYAMSGVPGSGRTKLAMVGRSVQPCLA